MPIDFVPDEFDFQPERQVSSKQAVAPEDILREDPRALEGPGGQVDRPREYLTVGGEFMGGLGDIVSAIKQATGKGPKQTVISNLRQADLSVPGVLGAVIGGSPTVRAGLGAARAAFSPLAPLSNVATSAGQTVSDILQKLGLTTGADIAGGLTSAIADVIGVPRLLGKAGQQAGAMRKALPLKSEKVADIRAKGVAQEAEIGEEAVRATQQAQKLREAQLGQLEEAKTTLPTQQEITFNKEAQQKQLQDLGDQQIKVARESASKQLSEAADTELQLRRTAEGAPTAEEAGKGFQAVFNERRQASKNRFNEEYQGLIEEGKEIESAAAGFKEAAEEQLGQAGTAKILQSRAEGAAAKAKRELTPVEDETYSELKAMFSDPDLPDNKKLIEALAKESNIPLQKDVSTNVGDLILARQRLKDAERAAYDSGKDVLGRQFKALRAGIDSDIAESGMASRLSEIDSAYAKEHAPFFSYGAPARETAESGVAGIVDRLVPKSSDPNRIEKLSALELVKDKTPIQKAWINRGVFEADQTNDFGKGIVSYWDNYSEPGDKTLKALLGNQYNDMRDIVTRLKTTKPKNLNKALNETVVEIEKRVGTGVSNIEKAELERLKSVEGLVAEGEKFKGKIFEGTLKRTENIAKRRDEAVAKLKKEIEQKVSKVLGKPTPPEKFRNYGQMILVAGGTKAALGISTGVPTAVTGGLMIMYADQLAKLMTTVRGTQLVRRLVRGIPGTSQAAANARQVQNYLRELDEKES